MKCPHCNVAIADQNIDVAMQRTYRQLIWAAVIVIASITGGITISSTTYSSSGDRQVKDRQKWSREIAALRQYIQETMQRLDQ